MRAGDDQYAISAFEQGAVDYLLKPADPERVAQTCQRLRDRLKDEANDLKRVVTDEAEAVIKIIAPVEDAIHAQITAEDLEAARPRRTSPPETGLHWLVTNYGHAREHLAHIQLTKQLLAAQS